MIPKNGCLQRGLARSYLSLVFSEAFANLLQKKIFWHREGIDLGMSPL
jgi:hypothetical protein